MRIVAGCAQKLSTVGRPAFGLEHLIEMADRFVLELRFWVS
jgi:hypothetical protein